MRQISHLVAVQSLGVVHRLAVGPLLGAARPLLGAVLGAALVVVRDVAAAL